MVTGPLLDSLRRDHAITQITLAGEAQIDVNDSHVRTLAVTPVRGAALVSAVDGRLPGGDREIMLGAATMRDTGARLGQFVRVTIPPAGLPHQATVTLVGIAAGVPIGRPRTAGRASTSGPTAQSRVSSCSARRYRSWRRVAQDPAGASAHLPWAV